MYFKKYNHDFIFFIKIVYKIKRSFSFKIRTKNFYTKKYEMSYNRAECL